MGGQDKGALALRITDLVTVVGDPRVSQVRLAEVLGYGDQVPLRRLIERHGNALDRLDGLSATVAESTGGRPGKVYWLSKKQALYLCTKSETEKATDVTIQMVEIFDLWMRGQLVPPPDLRDADLAEKRADHARLTQRGQDELGRRLATLDVLDHAVSIGMTLTQAVAEAAEFAGCCESTIWSWRSRVRMVSFADRAVALAPEYKGGGRQADIHPALWAEVTKRIARHGAKIGTCISQSLALAYQNDWRPHTLRKDTAPPRECDAWPACSPWREDYPAMSTTPQCRRPIADYGTTQLPLRPTRNIHPDPSTRPSAANRYRFSAGDQARATHEQDIG